MVDVMCLHWTNYDALTALIVELHSSHDKEPVSCGNIHKVSVCFQFNQEESVLSCSSHTKNSMKSGRENKKRTLDQETSFTLSDLS